MRQISIIIFLIMLFFNNVSVNAQSDISLSISKEMQGDKKYLNVTIRNDNPKDIVIFAYARWGGNDPIYLHSPISYAKIIGNPPVTQSKIETGKLVLSRNINEASMEEVKPYLIIKAGQSYTIKYLLFGETFNPYKTFSVSENTKIKKVEVKIKISYTYPNTNKMFVKQLTSKPLTL